MEIPVTLVTWVAAALPIIVLLILMLKCGWGATEAAPIGVLTALVIATTVFKSDLQLIAMESAKGIWSALTVLLVVWTAILLFEVASEAKAFRVFRAGMQNFTPNELLQVLILGWIFESFLQGITGFGVAVAVGAPLLVGIGVAPIWAVLIPLIGHSWANTFGTLAVAWDALVSSANLTADPVLLLRTALWAGIFIWIWNIILGISICWFYGKMPAVKKGLPAVIIISLIQGGGQLLLGQVNQTLCAFVPCCIALVVSLFLGKTKWYNTPWKVENSKIMDEKFAASASEDYPQDMSLMQAFMPYFVLTGITLFVLLIAPVKAFLGQVSIGFDFPEMRTGYNYVVPAVKRFSSYAPFTHASMFLLLASLIGLVFFRRHNWISKEGTKTILMNSIDKTVPSGIAVIGFIVMSRIMGGTGMTVVLAEGIAGVFGPAYTWLAAVIGMLGAFMTSSNMASNILFAEFQLTTANILGLDPAGVLAAQTAGGAIGNTICPGNIILGTTTAGILGKEGLVLKKVLPITVIAAVIVGGVLFVTQVVM